MTMRRAVWIPLVALCALPAACGSKECAECMCQCRGAGFTATVTFRQTPGPVDCTSGGGCASACAQAGPGGSATSAVCTLEE